MPSFTPSFTNSELKTDFCKKFKCICDDTGCRICYKKDIGLKCCLQCYIKYEDIYDIECTVEGDDRKVDLKRMFKIVPSIDEIKQHLIDLKLLGMI